MTKIIIVYFFFSLILVLIGDTYVLQRHVNAESYYLQVRDDTQSYINMIENPDDISDMTIHFKYRILVPFIGSVLPYSALLSLKIVSYSSLVLMYLSLLLLMQKLKIALIPSLIALIIVFFSEANLFIYHNPFLVDAFQFMVVALLIRSIIDRNFLFFIIFTIVGMLTKESLIFFVLLWFFVDAKQGLFLFTLSVIILYILRFILGPTEHGLTSAINIGVYRLQSPLTFLKDIIVSWRYLWIIAILGLIYMQKSGFRMMALSFFIPLFGAVLLCLVASDHLRMFSILLPVMVILCGYFINYLYEQKKYLWLMVFVLFSFSQSLVILPNIIFDNGTFEWFDQTRPYRIIYIIISMILLAGIVYTEKKSLKEKVIYIFNNPK